MGMSPGTRLRRRVVIALALGFGVIVAVWLRLGMRTTPNGNVAGLRFVGIRPDFSDTVYDPSGRRHHNEPYAGAFRDERFASNTVVPREFIFEYSSDCVMPQLQAPYWQIWSTNVAISRLYRQQVSVYPLADGGTRVTLPTVLPEFYFTPARLPRWLDWLPIQRVLKLPPRRDSIRVNVTAEYLPDEAHAAFQAKVDGPVEVGARVELEPGLVLTALQDGPLGEARFRMPDTEARPWLVFYDRALRRHWAEVRLRVDGNEKAVAVATVQTVARTNLAFIALEKPSTKTFYDIPVHLAGWKQHYTPVAVTTLETKLGTDALNVLAKETFQDPKQPVEAVGAVRGEWVKKFWNATFGWSFTTNSTNSALLHEPRRRREFDQAADSWRASYNPEVRGVARLADLALERPEAVSAAIMALPEQSGEIAYAIATSLVKHASELSESDVNRLGEVIRRNGDTLSRATLFQCLHDRNSPAGNALLIEFGLDPRPWVWRFAVGESLHIVTKTNIPPLLRHRAILMRMISARNEAEKLAAEQIALENLTPAVAFNPYSTLGLFLVGLEHIGGPRDKARATAALITILQAWDPLQRSDDQRLLIRKINDWNGTNFGGFRTGAPEPKLDWAGVDRTIAEIARWWASRAKP